MNIKHSALYAATFGLLLSGGIAIADTRVAVEKEVVIEQPVVTTPVIVEKRVLVPIGGRLTSNDVKLVLAANGFHDIHDIEWDRSSGVWEAEARDPSGDDREVKVDPVNGRILENEDD